MKFQAIKTNLSQGLSTVLKAVSSKNTLPILSGIHLSAQDGHIILSATDMDIRMVVRVPANVIEEGDTVLPGRNLGELVRRLPDDNISFDQTSHNGTDRMVITYGDAKAELLGWPGREFPTLPDVNVVAHYHMSGKLLKEAVNLTSFTINVDEIRAAFTGLLFEVAGQELTMVGTDSFRLALVRRAIDNPQEKDCALIIPVRALNEVARLVDPEEMVSIVHSDGRVSFEMGAGVVTTNLIRGEYPPYRRVIPEGYQSYMKVHRDLLQASVERATLFSKEKDGTSVINCALHNGIFSIDTESEQGRVHERVNVYHEGEEVDISFNARFITDCLKALHEDELDITFNGAMGPAIVRPQADDSYLYLILPLRR